MSRFLLTIETDADDLRRPCIIIMESAVIVEQTKNIDTAISRCRDIVKNAVFLIPYEAEGIPTMTPPPSELLADYARRVDQYEHVAEFGQSDNWRDDIPGKDDEYYEKIDDVDPESVERLAGYRRNEWTAERQQRFSHFTLIGPKDQRACCKCKALVGKTMTRQAWALVHRDFLTHGVCYGCRCRFFGVLT